MRKTEIETEEKEVERVYCDECTDECTDDYEVQASEVCPSCADGSNTFTSVKSMLTEHAHFDDQDGGDIVNSTLTILLYPIFIPLAWFDYASPTGPTTTRADLIGIIAITLGTMLWTLGFVALLLV